MKPFPNYNADNPADIPLILRYIVKERKNDVNDFIGLKDNFISGRSSGRIPTSSADVIDGDRVGDISFTPTYVYTLINNAGTAEWRRIALSTW